eukprot:gene4150-8089_t
MTRLVLVRVPDDGLAALLLVVHLHNHPDLGRTLLRVGDF